MNLPLGLLTEHWIWLSLLIDLPILIWAFYKAPWKTLKNNPSLQHLYLGMAVLLILLWSMRAGISPGLSIHFLGITSITLVFGWDLAVLLGTAVFISMGFLGHEGWDGIPVNILCSVLLPVASTLIVLKIVRVKCAKNFFVYLFLATFFSAAIAIALSGLSTVIVLWLDNVYSWQKIVHEYLQYLPLIMFPEALLNGILMTGLLVFHPDWVRTFDARLYLDEQ